MSLYLRKKVVGPFQCNCRLLICKETHEAALIDPGDEALQIQKWIKSIEQELGVVLKLKYLLHTHGHLDHIAATRELSGTYPEAKRVIHSEDIPLYDALETQAQMFGLSYGKSLAIQKTIAHEERLVLGKIKLETIHNPGHSPGSVSFRIHEDRSLGLKESVLSGDTLFQGSVGRTDLWGADGELMFQMIRERLLTLDDDTCVCPGHGPDSLMGIEKRSNPFLI
jgi:glyoxylase-like metal-dependent hydrolase (beta-lactamase superfamily II)